MEKVKALGAMHGAAYVVPPAGGENLWQPVPANGHISVRVAPHLVDMETPFSLGTQTVPAGGYVREHAHPHHDEVLHVISGTGTAYIDGETYKMVPDTTIFVGKNRWHKFVNDSADDLHWLWFITPAGLETFFAAVGRPKSGDIAPAPFPRPNNVAAIELATAFSDPATRRADLS